MTQVNYRIATIIAAIAIGLVTSAGALERDKLLGSEPTK